jgi:hypothetical protein
MAMLQTAFDVSYEEPGRSYLAMTGFVSEAGVWADFDRLWRARLLKDGLSYFHMQPFGGATSATPSKPFDKTWTGQKDRCEELLADLLDLIQSHAFRKFGTVVQASAAQLLSGTFDCDMPGIEVAGRTVAIECELWRAREKYANRVEHIFESGDLGKGKLDDAVTFANGGLRPHFRSKKDIPEKDIVGFTPLQAADILAYETIKAARHASFSTGTVPPGYVFRFPYRQLSAIPGQVKMWNDDSSRDINNLPNMFVG